MANESLIYLNGQIVPRSAATWNLEDRGMFFADGVYEVVRYYAGKPFGMKEHVERFKRSLRGIELPAVPGTDRLREICDEVVAANGFKDASIYWQATRGPAPRKHTFPEHAQPSLMVMAYPLPPLDPSRPVPAVKTILLPDERWHNCWIKSLMLLPNVLAKEKAHRADCDEAIFQRDDRVTEGTSTNVLAVRNGVIHTHPADHWILSGITRNIVLAMAGDLGMEVKEQSLNVDELRRADEVIITGSTTQVAAVTHIDGKPIGSAQAGSVATKLHRLFVDHVRNQCFSA